MADRGKVKTSVLVVDDDISMCRTISDILTDKGFVTECAMKGKDVLDLMRIKAYDVVLLDFRMPVLSGLDILREIKKKHPGTAIIMMTAYSIEKMMEECLKEGAFDVLRKPLDIDDIVRQIELANEGILVMVVDDDNGMRNTLKEILENQGYKVTVARDGAEALERTVKTPQNVLIVDMKMPALNGLETYLAIREINPKARTILMTAYKEETAEMIDMALSRDAYTCVYKPFDPAYIIGIIGRISRRGNIRRHGMPGGGAGSEGGAYDRAFHKGRGRR